MARKEQQGVLSSRQVLEEAKAILESAESMIMSSKTRDLRTGISNLPPILL